MLNSVAEFFEEDVNTRMQASLSLIEPAIMMVMGGFRGVRFDRVVSADLFVGGFDSLEEDENVILTQRRRDAEGTEISKCFLCASASLRQM